MNTLVIGYGNPLRGDDGVGSFVADWFGDGAIACHQLMPELAEPVSQADRVIFVDADVSLPPGRVRISDLQPGLTTALHRYNPEAILELSRQIYGRAPEAVMIAIGGQSYELCEGLTPVAIRAATRALRLTRREAARATAPSAPPARHP